MTRRLDVLLLAAALTTPVAARAQRAVIVVRHGENAGDTLTATGLAQAERLATVLGSAGVAAVYSTDSKRTIGTVTPLAEALRLKVQIYDTAAGPGKFDARPFVAQLRKGHPGDVVVVVGHVTTIPDLLHALGCEGDTTIFPTDYSNLFVVVPEPGGPPAFLRLKY